MISDTYRVVSALLILCARCWARVIAKLVGPPVLFVLACVVFLAGCQPSKPVPIKELSGPTMGTQWFISLGAGNTNTLSLDSLQKAVEAELLAINELMSTWDPSSELSLFNAAQSTQAAPLHPHTVTVLKTALQVSEATAGAYDVTRGNVFSLWGFGADEPPAEAPTESAINAALASSGWQHLQIQKEGVAKQFPEITIDLSSLAKGFAVDRVGQLLRDKHVEHYVVNIGGEIESRGERSENRAWRIGIELPDEIGSAESGLEVNDINLATSGSYRNVRFVDGKRVSHLINGRTGQPIVHPLVAATVVHQSTLLADAWSTAFMVAGSEWAKSYATANELAVQLTELDADWAEYAGATAATPSAAAFSLWQSPKWLELQVISAE